jgi:hypothetical protein
MGEGESGKEVTRHMDELPGRKFVGLRFIARIARIHFLPADDPVVLAHLALASFFIGQLIC